MKSETFIKNSGEFSLVYNHKESKANKYLVMYILKNDRMYSRIGISVSKKVGNSVVRHHLKRLVVVVRPSAKAAGFHEIESALLHLYNIHGISQSS